MNKTKGKKQNKVAIVALAALLTVGIVAGSLAYFTTTSTFNNVFKVGAPGGKIVETFDNPSPSDLIAGGTFNKSATVVNTGDTPIIARAKITAEWKNHTNQTITNAKLGGTAETDWAGKLIFGTTADFTASLFPFANDVPSKPATSTNKWFYNGKDGTTIPTADEYFYYKEVIAGSASSSPLLNSVAIKTGIGETTTSYKLKYNNGTADVILDGVSNAGYATANKAITAFNAAFGTQNPSTKYELYTETVATYKDFSGATLTVTITGEVIQADLKTLATANWVVPDAIKNAWNLA